MMANLHNTISILNCINIIIIIIYIYCIIITISESTQDTNRKIIRIEILVTYIILYIVELNILILAFIA